MHVQLLLEVGDEVALGGKLADQVVGKHEITLGPLLAWINLSMHLLLQLFGGFHTSLD
jgi:hypothetical protein